MNYSTVVHLESLTFFCWSQLFKKLKLKNSQLKKVSFHQNISKTWCQSLYLIEIAVTNVHLKGFFQIIAKKCKLYFTKTQWSKIKTSIQVLFFEQMVCKAITLEFLINMQHVYLVFTDFSFLHVLIRNYTFINFHDFFPPTQLIGQKYR